MSERGITAGFKSAKKQGCKMVVIDLDEHVLHLDTFELSKYISRRKADFASNMMHAFCQEILFNLLSEIFMKQFFSFIAAIVCAAACNHVNDSNICIIEGNLSGLDGDGWIYMTDVWNDSEIIDSVE